MGKCQSQPNGSQPELNFTHTSQPNKSQSKVHKKNSRDAPSDKFATAISQKDIPILTTAVEERIKQLGPFDYAKCGQFKEGSNLQPYKLKNGAIYVGQWHVRFCNYQLQNGKTHGKGTYYLPDYSVFQGVSVQNEIQGYGRIIHANGDYYEGEVRNSKANGQGTYVQDNVTYHGNFKDNLQSGQGIQFSDQYQFKGEFWQGQKQKGILKLKHTQKYQYNGEFKNNKFNGYGVLINDVGKYQGQFLFGKKHGWGKFTWGDGSYYEGEYKNDEKHGQGKLFSKKGKIIKDGVWKKNVAVD